jgi:hypothetical protein
MRTAVNPKSNKNGPKKKFTVENLETGLSHIAEAGRPETRGIFEEAIAAKPSIRGVSSEEKYQLIAEAAYFRSEKRSFAPGNELKDWLDAEAEIESRLTGTSASIGSPNNVGKRPRRR